MKSTYFLAVAALVCLLTAFACTDPTFVGTELLEGDRAEVAYTDTLAVKATTILGDSVITYSPDLVFTRSDFYFGDMADPVFGRTIAAVYAQPRLFIDPVTGDLLPPNFTNAQIDSVVLVLPLSLSGHYGFVNQPFGVEILAMTERINSASTYYSNVSFNTGASIGQQTITPRFDSVFVTRTFAPFGDTALVQPHMRVKLSDQFASQLAGRDSAQLSSDSLWLDFLPGIMIKPNAVSQGLLNLKLANTWAGIYVYYSRSGVPGEYIFPLRSNSPRVSSYQYQRNDAVVEPFIGSAALSDSLLFLQGLQGLFVELTFPELRNLQNYAVNRATLELTMDLLAVDDTAKYKLPPQLVLIKRNATTGNLDVIQDVSISTDLAFHGGRKSVKDGLTRYELNIPFHLQYMLEGTQPEKLYLAISPVGSTPNRVVLRGSGRSDSPVRLKLALTSIQ